MRPDTASATRFQSGVIIVPQRERGVCESAAYMSEHLLRRVGRRDVIRSGRCWLRNSRQCYLRSSVEVKNFVPSKKRFGRLNTEMNVVPLGACATWMLPPGLHTKSPAPTLPSESS